ncbi:MAG: hypothetical protein E7056_03180 [Lentisphaerae bacterium]|nr:hypothetical protein [Lentisphaerota bacterium]
MFLVELLEVFFAPFVLIYKLFMPDSETGKATIPGYVFVPLGLVFGSVLLLGLLWSLAVAFFPKLASAPAPQPEKPKSVIVQKADQVAIYSGKVTGKADEYLSETPEAAQKRHALNDQIKSLKQTLDDWKTTPEAAAETPGGPVEASLKDKLANKAGAYSGKLANKADEYLGETPEAAQKRATLQNKLKKANSFLKSVQKLTSDIAK